jgi:radical SAM enzyme (rSAM/lipoprotein system)
MRGIPLKTRLGLELFRLYRGVQTRLHELTYLFWECTLRCNLNCRHCGSDCQKSSATPDMPLTDFLPVLEQIARHQNPNKTMIAVTGGEPLLRTDLEACGRAFYRLGFPWGIVTNGYCLTPGRLQSLTDAGLRSLTISLDGMAASHDWLRGAQGCFERTVAAISRCSQADGLVFDVVTCVNQRNLTELERLKTLLTGMGVKRWRLFTIFPKGRAAGEEQLRFSGEDLRRLMDFIAACRAEGRIEASYGCEGFLGSYEGRVRDGFFFCKAGVNVASVLVDGGISACPSLRGDYVQGNIYRDDFLACWENRFEVMRNRSWTRTGNCANCKVYRWCQGNGLHLRDEKSAGLLHCHHEMLSHQPVFRVDSEPSPRAS